MAKGRKTGSRRAGAPNKIGAEVRAAISDAFVQAGGGDYLVRVADDTFVSTTGIRRGSRQ